MSYLLPPNFTYHEIIKIEFYPYNKSKNYRKYRLVPQPPNNKVGLTRITFSVILFYLIRDIDVCYIDSRFYRLYNSILFKHLNVL